MLSADGHGPAVLHVLSSRAPSGLCLHLAGELDLATAGQLVQAVRALPEADLQRLRLDLTDLEFLDAAGLRALLASHAHVAAQGGQLQLAGVRPIARRMMLITGLDAALPVDGRDADGGPGLSGAGADVVAGRVQE